MSRQRLVILQDRLRPGGTERQSLWLARHLPDHGLETCLLFFEAPGDSTALDGISWQALQPRSVGFPWFAPGLIRVLRQSKATAVLCMGRNANAYAAWIRLRLPEVRVVSTCRTNQPLSFPYRLGIRRSHLCLTNSAWAADSIVAKGLKAASHVRVIPNALLRPELLTLDRSPEAIASARRKLGVPHNAPVLCNIAHFVPGKNQEALIRVFSQLAPATHLLLAGDGPRRRICQDLAHQLGISARVHFLGSTEAVETLLQASDLFLSTALRDSLPNAIVEAQAAGLPVVAWDVAGVTEAFLPGRSGLAIPVRDEAGTATAIQRLLRSPEERSEFVRAGRSYAKSHFSPKAIGQAYPQTLLAP